MTVEAVQVPPPHGSVEWVKTLNVRSSRDCQEVTTAMRTGAQGILGETFNETVWDRMFADGDGMHTRNRGNSRYANPIIHLMQAGPWSTTDPEFEYVSARVVTSLVDRVRVRPHRFPVTVYRLEGEGDQRRKVEVRKEVFPKAPNQAAMIEQLDTFVEEKGITEERRRELDEITRFVLLAPGVRNGHVQTLRREGISGLLDALT